MCFFFQNETSHLILVIRRCETGKRRTMSVSHGNENDVSHASNYGVDIFLKENSFFVSITYVMVIKVR